MTINDIVLPMETCKRLKDAGFEFPDSVFGWVQNVDEKDYYVIEREILGTDGYYHLSYVSDALTLHEVYCWFLKLSIKPEFRGDTPQIKFIYGDTDMEDRIIFSTCDEYTGHSAELNPLIAADRYINNLIDKGVLRK